MPWSLRVLTYLSIETEVFTSLSNLEWCAEHYQIIGSSAAVRSCKRLVVLKGR